MHAKLAELYATIPDASEKLAALQGLAERGEVDLNILPASDLLSFLEDQGEDPLSKIDQEKVAEADGWGRLMAQTLWSEAEAAGTAPWVPGSGLSASDRLRAALGQA